jgi:UDP-glucose 4-epimerase
MKNVLVTGGAGFIGSNLIKALKIQYPDINISSLDNYFTGKYENHVPGVEYYRGHTWEIDHIFRNKMFDTVFHFGEYSRIVKSFDDIDYVQRSILSATPIILDLCRRWNAKLIYSASSSKFGNGGKDENLSPYSWCKSKMVELIKNYGDWFGLDYEICYFFNVYGPGQITEGDYATVIGIFEKQYMQGLPLTVVEPGTQSRDFTHVNDVTNGIIKSVEKSLNGEWHLRSGKNVTILDVADMFDHEIKMVPQRRGERFTSHEFESDTEMKLEWKPVYKLEDWIQHIKELRGATNQTTIR